MRNRLQREQCCNYPRSFKIHHVYQG
uniref:Uncharacterized protein n=1 Tax=Anguilla anguilla TaxID=7936 RepID=A0A0E9UDR5_ANGAN